MSQFAFLRAYWRTSLLAYTFCMEEVENYNIRLVQSLNGIDYYIQIKPGEYLGSARLDDPSQYIAVKSDSPNGVLLREMSKRSGIQYRMYIRDNYEGMRTIKSLEVYDRISDFSLKFRDPDTGGELSLKFNQKLAKAHEHHMQSLALEGFANTMFSRDKRRLHDPEEADSEERLERLQVVAHMHAQLEANAVRETHRKYNRVSHLFNAYKRRKEFEKIKTDLFPLYAMVYRPAVARPMGAAKGDGQDFYLPSLFKSKEEEAAFMLALYEEPVDSTEETPEVPLNARIRAAVPDLPPDVVESLAFIYSRAGPNSKRHLRSLYDRKILITEDPDAASCREDLQEAAAQVERVIENRGIDGLRQIYSMELRNLIREHNSKLQGVDIANLPSPKRFFMNGKLYEFISVNPANRGDFIAIGPISDTSVESYERIYLDERMKSPDDPDKLLGALAEKFQIGIVPPEELTYKKIEIDGMPYSFGEHGHLYAGDYACNIEAFAHEFLQPPTLEMEDYVYTPEKFLQLAKASLGSDGSNMEDGFSISGDCGNFIFARTNEDTGPIMPFIELSPQDMATLSVEEEEAWIREHINTPIPEEDEKLIAACVTGDKLAMGQLQERYPAVSQLFESNAPLQQEDLQSAVHAEFLSSELDAYISAHKQETYEKLLSMVDKEPDARVRHPELFQDLNGELRVVDGKLYCAPEANEKLHKRTVDFFESLHDKTRGEFPAPKINRSDPYDGAWHESDAQQMPEYARDILHKFRDVIKTKYGEGVKNDLDKTWYDTLSQCNDVSAEITDSMSAEDRMAYMWNCVALSRGGDTPLTAADMDMHGTESFSLDDLIDPNLSYDDTPLLRRKNPDKFMAFKEMYLNSFIAVQMENTAAFMEDAYADLVNSSDVSNRLQVPSPAFCQGTPGELCVKDARYTAYGEHNIHNAAALAIRETLKAMAYIRNGCKDLPTGERADIGLVKQITDQLPPESDYTKCSAAELMQAAYKAGVLRSSATSETLLKEDKEAFRDKVEEISRIRRKQMEDTLTTIFTTPGKALSRFAAALEQL